MIHKYKMNGLNIVLDVFSGSVHLLDDITYDILCESLEETLAAAARLETVYEKNQLAETVSEVIQLKEEGLLFADDIYEQLAAQPDSREPVVKALCLHIAHDCNLKCRYCFAEEGEYHGKRSLMSFDVGKKAIDFLIQKSGKRKNLEVDFFGGEPLLNFEVVKQIVDYAGSQEKLYNKHFRFTLTTNGMLLNEDIEAYVNEHMHNVVLSIDGRREVNDKMRLRAGGQGSYDSIVPRFQHLAESRGQNNYYVRGTFTGANLDFTEDVLHLASLGFKQISVEPVVAQESEDYAIKKEDLPVIFQEYERLAKEILERNKNGAGINFFHFMIDLTGGPCVAKRLAGCGAGTKYLAVTPEGELYPCHQFVGDEDFRMGDVYKGINNTKKYEEFDSCHVYAKEDCKDCFAKFYCSGGCAANAYHANEDILKPYSIGCEMQRKRTECAIMIKVAESISQKEDFK